MRRVYRFILIYIKNYLIIEKDYSNREKGQRDVGTRRSLCHCFTPGNSRSGRAPHEPIAIQGKKITSKKKKKKKKKNDGKKKE